ncbi:hypothetical protein Acsp05_52110 [Actinokineospora sp. NBRC 105648]|nr:hypothetical protein Acsp05_52110 [Actinokineospora sp. NBRC 105648]
MATAAAVADRTDVTPPTPAESVRAVAAANTPQAISFATTNLKQGGQPEPAAVTVAGSGIPVYTLNPDFVRGDPVAAAGRFAYVAVLATADDGRKATLMATQDPRAGWAVTSVLSGDDEHRLLARVPPGGVLLNEPQINGWYALTHTEVTLLQASLPQTPVGQPIPLDDYQRQVSSRYGDKLPGSTYQNNGGIGFPLDQAPSSAQPSAQPSGRPTAKPADTSTAPSHAWWYLGGAALVLAAAGFVAVWRTPGRTGSAREPVQGDGRARVGEQHRSGHEDDEQDTGEH